MSQAFSGMIWLRRIVRILRLFINDLLRVDPPPKPPPLRVDTADDPMSGAFADMLERADEAVIDEDARIEDYTERAGTESDETIDAADYWWSVVGSGEPVDTPLFELIDDYRVNEELERMIEKDQFPVIELPSNVVRAMQLMNNPEFQYRDVAELISHSPALTGEFIRTINSSLYTRGERINDLHQILPRLGKSNVKMLLYMYSSKLGFADIPILRDLAASIVEHSYVTGVIVSYLSRLYYPDHEEAFLAGLMHDIGKLGILKAVSEAYPLPQRVDFDMTEEVFDKIFPPLHEKAGGFLAAKWELDDAFVNVIAHHHDYHDVGFDETEQLNACLCRLVHVADAMARMLGHGRSFVDDVNVFELAAASELGLEKSPDAVRFLDDVPPLVDRALKTET